MRSDTCRISHSWFVLLQNVLSYSPHWRNTHRQNSHSLCNTVRESVCCLVSIKTVIVHVTGVNLSYNEAHFAIFMWIWKLWYTIFHIFMGTFSPYVTREKNNNVLWISYQDVCCGLLCHNNLQYGRNCQKLPHVPHGLYLWMVGLNLQLWYHFIQKTTI